MVFNTDEQWVVDLIKVQTLAEQNKGYRYTLVVIDAFSKYAWAQPSEKKTGKDVTDAFAKILKEAQGRKPQTLKTDADKELYNQTFQELLKKNTFITFLPMEMPKPVSFNDLIEPLNRNCIFISQLPIHSNM